MRDPCRIECAAAAAGLVLVAMIAACGGPAGPDLSVVLEPDAAGRVNVVVTNAGVSPIRFLDVREGTALCGAFWQVDVQVRGGTSLTPRMTYTTTDMPLLVSLEPGQEYRRPIHLAAYVEPYQAQPGETAILTVRYRVRNPDRWRGWIDDASLIFVSRPLVVSLEEFL